MRERDDDEDEFLASFTRAQKRDVMEMVEDYKRRKWMRLFFGKVVLWVAAAATGIEAAQTIIGKYLAR